MIKTILQYVLLIVVLFSSFMYIFHRMPHNKNNTKQYEKQLQENNELNIIPIQPEYNTKDRKYDA